MFIDEKKKIKNHVNDKRIFFVFSLVPIDIRYYEKIKNEKLYGRRSSIYLKNLEWQ